MKRYELLNKGDVIQVDDEILIYDDDLRFKQWEKSTCAGVKVNDGIFRREIKEPVVSTQYRKLVEGEIIKEGDEFHNPDNTWLKTQYPNTPVISSITYRRKIKKEKPFPKHMRIKEKHSSDPFVVYFSELEVGKVVSKTSIWDYLYYSNNWDMEVFEDIDNFKYKKD